MPEAIVSGVLLGGVLALLVGPVFFMLIQTSIKKGFVPAVMLSLGVILSDGLIAMLAYWGSSSISELKSLDSVMGRIQKQHPKLPFGGGKRVFNEHPEPFGSDILDRGLRHPVITKFIYKPYLGFLCKRFAYRVHHRHGKGMGCLLA